MTINLNNTPIKEIIKVEATIEKTITMTHGSYTGCLDAIPDIAVLEIVQISQGQNVYSNGSDYRLKSGNIDWSPTFSEPAPGSNYKLIYRVRGKLIPTDITEKSFKIKGAVNGSLVLVDYSWKLPRYDLITIDSKGVTSRIQGISHQFNPSFPKTPSNQISLAYITQNWDQDSKPTITNCSVKVIPMSDIEAMRSAINNLYSLLAEERLKNDANASDPASKKGIFVDPFLDDDMRDQGTPQTASIVDHCLTLPIKAEIFDLGKVDKPWTLPYELTPILEQTLQTSSMKINPYQSFAPVPADAKITLDIDRWSEIQTTWSSPVTQRFNATSSPLTQKTYVGTGLPTKELSRSTSTSYSTSTSTNNELLSSKIIEGEFMRQAKQTFNLKGFQPKENLTIIFDGITATATNLEKK